MTNPKRMPAWQAQERALELARGSYQVGIVLGRYRLSGGDLKGKARQYGGAYKRSRDALIERLKRARIPYRIEGGTAVSGPAHLLFGTRSATRMSR